MCGQFQINSVTYRFPNNVSQIIQFQNIAYKRCVCLCVCSRGQCHGTMVVVTKNPRKNKTKIKQIMTSQTLIKHSVGQRKAGGGNRLTESDDVIKTQTKFSTLHLLCWFHDLVTAYEAANHQQQTRQPATIPFSLNQASLERLGIFLIKSQQ